MLAQGEAIRERDVDAVLARLADIQTEMGRRGALEQDRAALLQRAGAPLGVPARQVTLERLCALDHPRRRRRPPRERSAELRGLLAEIAREHGINRALMRQELAFLVPPHAARRPASTEPGYQPAAAPAAAPHRPPAAPPLHRALDLQA